MKTFINIYQLSKDDDFFFVKDKEGTHKMSIPWYFVVKRSDATKIKSELQEMKKMKYVDKFERQGEWIKIYCPYNRRDSAIKYVHSLDIQTYEADLPMWMRYLIDEDIELDVDQKILYFDIETNGLDLEHDAINTIGAIGSDGKRYQFFDPDNEKKILKQFVNVMEKYDIITGWNSETFDLVAITNRCKFHGIKIGCYVSEWDKAGIGGLTGVRVSGKFRARPQTFNHIDMMMKVKEMHYRDTELIKKVRSFSLESVAKAFLPDHVHKMDLPNKSFKELVRTHPELVKEYNMRDVEILVELDKKLNVIKQKLIEHQVCNARLNDYTSHGKIDPFALRAARRMGQHLFTKPERSNSGYKQIDPALQEESGRGVKADADYIGGFVFEPIRGLHRNIYVFDFQSLYPSIIKTFNISLDTYLGVSSENPNLSGITLPISERSKQAVFAKDRKGIIPTIIQNVLDERNKIRFGIMKEVKKDSPEYWNWHYRQYAFKVLANSMYGVMGAGFSRFFKRELAEGITLTGQYLIKMMWKWMEDKGFQPIYGDSDSLFVKIDREVNIEKMGKAIKKYLDKDLLQYNINESSLAMDFEKKFERFIMVAKKKYIGLAADGSMKISGLEFKKRDTLPKAEEWQKFVVDTLLTKSYPVEFFQQLVKDWHKKVYSGQLKKEELTFQKRLSHEIDSYGKKNVRDKKNGGFRLDKLGNARKVPVPVHVRVAIGMKERYKSVRAGDKADLTSAGSYIPYIIVGSTERNEAIYAEEFDGSYDKDYYWEACYGASQRILEVVFPEVDWTMKVKKLRKIKK